MTTSHIKKKAKVVILSAPSGAGKTTIEHELCRRISNIKRSISYTTRPIRKNEREGIDYYFVSKQRFLEMRDAHAFLEHASVHGNFYGTAKHHVEKTLTSGYFVLLVIDVKGAQMMRSNFAKNNRDDIVSVFLLPPSFEETQKRLNKRASDDSEVIKQRLYNGIDEIANSHDYDFAVINHEIARSCNEIIAILNEDKSADGLRHKRQQNFIDDLLKQFDLAMS